MAIQDKGLWITWYDLPADGRDAYLSWLHENYIPQILGRRGVLWGGTTPRSKNQQDLLFPGKLSTRTICLCQQEAAIFWLSVLSMPVCSAILFQAR